MLKGPSIDRIASLEDRHRHFADRILLEIALGFQQARGERRAVDGNIQARPEVGQRTVVILMRMRDDDRLEVLALGSEKADVGQHQIDARKIRTREGDAAIDHDPLAVICRAVAV